VRMPDLLTPAEKRLAALLFVLAAIGAAVSTTRRLSPDVAAWLDALEAGPADAPEAAAPAEAPGDAPPRGEPETPPGPVILDPNRASASELTSLPGIGPALAGRIVLDRERNGPFRAPEDLLRVKGIGPATMERILPWLRMP